ncbi:YIP1 family protein [Pedobacter gandavensis]|uniref:YIP1 family protein n=1 Tax=Pedobacter gandavensis TaxID=2679963 RepID=UPI00292EE220|nr:YIP1 family protein [Pedobacter gandavensis]
MKTNNIYKNNFLPLFLILCMAQCLIALFLDIYVLTEDKLRLSMEGKYEEKIIDYAVQSHKKQWIVTLIQVPILTIITIVIESIALYIACQFLEIKKRFNQFMVVVTVANFVFIIPALVKLIYFMFRDATYSIKDVNNFSVGSLANLFQQEVNTPVYPVLKSINIFQAFFIWLLCIGMSYILDNDKIKAKKVVFSGYVTLFFLYLIVIYLVTSILGTHA